MWCQGLVVRFVLQESRPFLVRRFGSGVDELNPRASSLEAVGGILNP